MPIANGPAVALISLDHAVLGQDCQLAARQAQFAAENLSVVLADQRRAPGDLPGRSAIDRGLAGIDEAAAEFGMLDGLPESAVVQMRVVEQRLGRTHRAPGEAALLRGVI